MRYLPAVERPRKTAVVTGASGELGGAYARLFAADGHDVVMVARRRHALDGLAKELRDRHGIGTCVVEEDLADPSAARRIHDVLCLAGREVEYLVNNASFGADGPFAEADVARQLEMIQVNVTSLVHLTGLLLPAMVARRSGHVLNVGSLAGFQPGPFRAVYHATQAFVNSFTEALWVELEGTGVTATVSCPGLGRLGEARAAATARPRGVPLAASQAAKIAAEGYRAMMKGKPLAVHGLRNKAALQALRVSPRAAIRRVARGR